MNIPLQHLKPAPIELFGGGHDAYEIKFGSITRRIGNGADVEGIRAVIVGFPVDEGVRLNHGRPGAAAGPDCIRRSFYRLNANRADRVSIKPFWLGDLGNIVPGSTVEESQQRLGAVVTEVLAAGWSLIVLGGGHETAAGHLYGHIGIGGSFAVFNVDPHLDVRESPGGIANSGNPFRLAQEHAGLAMRYTCIGARPAANAPAYAEYVLEHGGTIHWEPLGGGTQSSEILREELGRMTERRAALSLDVDGVASAHAPGSSAANPQGTTPAEFIRCAALAGADRRVASLEISEFAPNFDRDYQTERLCAIAMQAFLLERAAH